MPIVRGLNTGVFVVILFSNLKKKYYYYSFVVAICDLVHQVETIRDL